MLKVFFITTVLFITSETFSQQKEGRVIYQRNMEVNITLSDNMPLPRNMPTNRMSNFELNFANNQASWRMADELPADDNAGNGAFNVRVIGGGDDFTFFNLEEASKLQQTELAGKNYLVSDSIRRSNWKLTEETKIILGHSCRKAVAVNNGKRTTTIMENGKMETKEVADTSVHEAWFTTDIPVAVGPEMQGQLPGLILELSLRSGRIKYTAVEILQKADQSQLKAPTKGKKISAADFAKERNKLFREMQQNGAGGPGFRIQVSN